MKYAKYAVVVLALALVMGITAAPAAAAEQYTGSFTLSADAYWGSKLLPAGDYKISVNLDKQPGVHQATVYSESLRSTIVAGPSMNEPAANQNSLQLEQINGVYVIRQLDAGLAGRSFRFIVAKNARAHAEQSSASAKLTVPVNASAY